MHRSIGKRIRMDEPPPEEYWDSVSPTPMEEDVSENLNIPATPQSFNADGNNMECNDENLTRGTAGSSFEMSQLPSFDESLSPMQLRGGRMTRGRLRNQGKQDVQIPSSPEFSPLKKQKRCGRPRAINKELMGFNSSDTTLFVAVKNAKIPLNNLVEHWITSYKENREPALLVLMQFFLNSSGCKGVITHTPSSSAEHSDIIRKMTEEFDEDSGDYPLIMPGLAWKKFRVNFCDFITQLINQCQHSIIYDDYLMDNVSALLTGLSDSQVRAFRHTATLAAMKIMTAYVDVALAVSKNLDNTQRQYESERQKSRDKRASDRLDNLLSKRQELEENMCEIKNVLTFLFKSVFVHRYRDSFPEIRAICMGEVGSWMTKFHQLFLDDSYLKYIGWTLNDKVSEVRLKCLQALQPLYATDEFRGKLELFTSKFKERIVAMTLDRDPEVAVEAVRLVISIFKNHRDILSDKDCEHVYELVYSSDRAVAQASGEFLNERLFVPEEVVSVQRSKRGKKRLPNTTHIRDLVQFFIESELHEHGAYLVDSLIESNAMMKDWECMTDLLIEEPGPSEEPLDDRQETSLVEIMTCCVKQAATGEAPVGRVNSNRKITQSVKETKQMRADKVKLTEHFIQVLPIMLDKYQTDTEKLSNILTLPQYFDLEVYSVSRQEANLESLLKKIQIITEKHHDTGVLEQCAKALEFLCSEGYAIYTRCDIQRSTLIDSIVNRCKEAMENWNFLGVGQELPDEDDVYSILNSLKKVSIFYSCHNLNNWNLWDSLIKNVEEAIHSTTTLPEEAIVYCMSSCYFSIIWEMHSIEDLIENSVPVEDHILKLKHCQIRFMQLLKDILIQGQNKKYSEEAYLYICDLLVMFCHQLHTNSALKLLVYQLDSTVHQLLNSFLQTHVFTYEENDQLDEHSKIAELHKRRNLLASFCKLIIYGILPSSSASDISKHYANTYDDYGDIIKTLISRTKECTR